MKSSAFFPKIWLLLAYILIILPNSTAQVIPVPVPENNLQLASEHYKVTIEQNGKSYNCTPYFSFREGPYKVHDKNGKLIQEKEEPYSDVDANMHSTAIFSFEGKVKVTVEVLPGAPEITLPLTSAKILPSSYNIPAKIVDGNKIEFSLDKPEKVAIIANYDKAMLPFYEKAKGHQPVTGWNEWSNEKGLPTFKAENLTISEGFLNPLFVFAHPKEKNVPEKTAKSTLIVNPKDKITQEQILGNYKTIWFAPGVHDLSGWGKHPDFLTYIRRGQKVYLEAGSYVMATFKAQKQGSGISVIEGRGVLSGIKGTWAKITNGIINDIDTIRGITITDRPDFGLHGARYVEDIAMIGAWHANSDAFELRNCKAYNLFLMAKDDNLKIHGNAHAKHVVLWQQANAHPLMVQANSDTDFDNTLIEDLDIIAYLKEATRRSGSMWDRLSSGAIACVRGGDSKITNITFRDIRIEGPFLYRPVAIYNLNTNVTNPGWFRPTSEDAHTRIDGMTFENISVNVPLISYESVIDSEYANSLKNVTFKNLKINGDLVTEKNKEKYFEIGESTENIRFIK